MLFLLLLIQDTYSAVSTIVLTTSATLFNYVCLQLSELVVNQLK